MHLVESSILPMLCVLHNVPKMEHKRKLLVFRFVPPGYIIRTANKTKPTGGRRPFILSAENRRKNHDRNKSRAYYGARGARWEERSLSGLHRTASHWRCATKRKRSWKKFRQSWGKRRSAVPTPFAKMRKRLCGSFLQDWGKSLTTSMRS